MFIIYLHTKFHKPRSSGPRDVAIKPKGKEMFAQPPCCFYVPQKKKGRGKEEALTEAACIPSTSVFPIFYVKLPFFRSHLTSSLVCHVVGNCKVRHTYLVS